jgi:hypothetical protein
MRMNHGFAATCGPSTTARQICRNVSRPKITPVVAIYGFIGGIYDIAIWSLPEFDMMSSVRTRWDGGSIREKQSKWSRC